MCGNNIECHVATNFLDLVFCYANIVICGNKFEYRDVDVPIVPSDLVLCHKITICGNNKIKYCDRNVATNLSDLVLCYKGY